MQTSLPYFRLDADAAREEVFRLLFKGVTKDSFWVMRGHPTVGVRVSEHNGNRVELTYVAGAMQYGDYVNGVTSMSVIDFNARFRRLLPVPE